MSVFLGRLTEEQIKDKQAAQQQLLNWQPKHDFLACFDVDGHLLDNMTAKQMIVFQPHFMDILGLREIETWFRLHAEHHNLWGKDRGCDRHEAISLALGSLTEDPSLKAQMPEGMTEKLVDIKASLDGYIDDIRATGEAYGVDSLLAYAQAHPQDLNTILFVVWSKAVDLTFPFVTIPMEPFAGVRETLAFVAEQADILIVSKTPYTDICNWLERHDLTQYVTAVSGKEQGGKDEHICLAMGGTYDAAQKAVVTAGDKYVPERVIMGGDGSGDMKAVKKNGGLFFPTPPGAEEQAWAEALEGVFKPFFKGSYGELEPAGIEAFQAAMLPRGPWAEEGYDHRTAYLRHQPKREQLYAALKPGGKLVRL